MMQSGRVAGGSNAERKVRVSNCVERVVYMLHVPVCSSNWLDLYQASPCGQEQI